MIESIIAGLVSGAAASIGLIWAHAHGYIKIEKTELRKMKVALVEDVISCRYAISSSHKPTEEDAFFFNKTVAKIPFIFHGDKFVMEKYDSFVNDVKNVDKLINLIRSICSSSGIGIDVSESNARKTITIVPRWPDYDRSN